MAQYVSDDGGEDFSDIGDILGDFNYATLNADDDHEKTTQNVVNKNAVPLYESDKSGPKSKTTPADLPESSAEKEYLVGDAAVTQLLAICDELGISSTLKMETQIFRLSKAEHTSRETIRWYVRGYATCATSTILGTLSENMSDMKTEIKKLQSVSHGISKGSDGLRASAERLSKEIESVRGDVKDRIGSALSNVEKSVTDTLHRVGAAGPDKGLAPPTSTINEGIAIETVNKNRPVKPSIDPVNLVGEKAEPVTIEVPKSVPPPAGVGNNSKETAADSSESELLRRSMMSKLGFSRRFIMHIDSETLMKVFPQSLLAEVKGIPLTPRIVAALKKTILANLNE